MNCTLTGRAATFSVASLIAVLAAIFSFPAGAFWGLVLALIAIAFGLVGVVIALSPAKRGGFVSILSVFAGLVGILAALVKIVAWIF